MVAAALAQNCSVVRHVSDAVLDELLPVLLSDRDAVMAAVMEHGAALEYATSELQADRDIVMEAVRSKGWALQWASAALKDDFATVLTAVQQVCSPLF